MIECVAQFPQIPDSLLAHADSIKMDNYKINYPGRFKKHETTNRTIRDSEWIAAFLGSIMECDREQVNWVYFSCARGARPHTDLLDPKVYGTTTWVTPIILPSGDNTITVGDTTTSVKLNHVYRFNHNVTHSMQVSDVSHGCVVIMASKMERSEP